MTMSIHFEPGDLRATDMLTYSEDEPPAADPWSAVTRLLNLVFVVGVACAPVVVWAAWRVLP
jgi:hypothetical protein